MPDKRASIIVPVFNGGLYIKRCIEAILGQSYSHFEFIIVDDCSSDNTEEIIRSINDNRVIYIRNNRRMGIAYSRNVGIKKSSTNYIFFTDADCMPSKYWLQEGMETFEKNNCLGVEGMTCYETARTSITDRIIENFKGGTYITCNIAYKKKILEEVGYFNEDYKFVSEDTDLARKILNIGIIEFSGHMLVFHQRIKQGVSKYFQDAFRVFSKAKYIKDTNDYRACFGKVMYPGHLLIIVFPPLLVLRYRIASFKELILLPLIYLSYVFERLLIWIASVKEKILLI